MAQNVNDYYQPEERWKAVVDHGRGWLVVNAGPGTGKTYSLLRKIEALISASTSPHGIYYLTASCSMPPSLDRVSIRQNARENAGVQHDLSRTSLKVSLLRKHRWLVEDLLHLLRVHQDANRLRFLR